MSEKLLPTLLTIAIVAVVFALMWRGWRARIRRQSGLPQLPEPPADLLERVSVRADGMYVATTHACQPLERIAVHGMGVRGNAQALVTDAGVLLNRQGAPDLYIPRERLHSVSTTSGMVGKFVERDGLVVFTWRFGDTLVDTGFRARTGAQSHRLEAAAAALTTP